MAIDLQLCVPISQSLDTRLNLYPPISILKLDRDYNLFEQIQELPYCPIHPFSIVINNENRRYDDYGRPLRFVFAKILLKNFRYNVTRGYMNPAVKLFLSTLPPDLHIVLNWS